MRTSRLFWLCVAGTACSVWHGRALGADGAGAPEYRVGAPRACGLRSELRLDGVWEHASVDSADVGGATGDDILRSAAAAAWRRGPIGSRAGLEIAGSRPYAALVRTHLSVARECALGVVLLRLDRTGGRAAVFIDGRLAGVDDGIPAPWVLDVTEHLSAPGSHELLLALVPSASVAGERLSVGSVAVVCAGRRHVGSVEVTSRVAERRLEAVAVVHNRGREHLDAVLVAAASALREDAPVHAFDPVGVSLPAGETAAIRLGGEWGQAEPWWPEPGATMSRLAIDLRLGDELLDRCETVFGFSDLEFARRAVYVNGVRRNLWGWAPPPAVSSPDDLPRWCRALGVRLIDVPVRGLPHLAASCDEILSVCDRGGIAVQLTIEPPAAVAGADAWVREAAARSARAYRTHPSLFAYRLEGSAIVPGELAGLDAARAWCSSTEGVASAGIRCVRVDGRRGDAVSSKELLERLTVGGGDPDEPVLLLADRAAGTPEGIFGPGAWRTGADNWGADADWHRRLHQIGRAAGLAAFLSDLPVARREYDRAAFDDVAVTIGRAHARLASGVRGDVPVTVHNDTWREADVEFSWAYWLEDRVVAVGEETVGVAAGSRAPRSLSVAAWDVERRTDGRLVVFASVASSGRFVREWPVPVLPRVTDVAVAGPLAVFDPADRTAAFLADAGLRFERIARLGDARARSGTLIVGPQSLDRAAAAGNDLMAFAVGGGRVVVLEQDAVPGGLALPVELEYARESGEYAFLRGGPSAVSRDLADGDLSTWRCDGPGYEGSFVDVPPGVTSFADCGPDLRGSVVTEVPCGEGVIVICHLRVGAGLRVEPAADVLLRNLLEHCSSYRRSSGGVAVCADAASGIGGLLEESRAAFTPVDSAVDAIDEFRYRCAVVQATEARLARLAGAHDQFCRFQEDGGWVVLWDVRPEALEGLNALLKTSYALSAFDGRRVSVAERAHPLARDLGDADFAALRRGGTYAWTFDGVAPRNDAGAPAAVALDDASGLVVHARGRGGTLICQLRHDEAARAGDPAAVRPRMLGGLLRAMGAGDLLLRAAVPGVNVAFDSVHLARAASAGGIPEPAWMQTLAARLPTGDDGRALAADVPFAVPSDGQGRPTGILLGEIARPVEIARTADVVYFLHAAAVPEGGADRPGVGRPVGRYVVTYADGRTQAVSIEWERTVGAWLRTGDAPLPGACAVAAGGVPGRGKATAFVARWTNLRPSVRIATIHAEPDGAAGGVKVVVFGITTGVVRR